MGYYAIDEANLTAIGDAIRAKKGEDKYLRLTLVDEYPYIWAEYFTFSLTQEQLDNFNKVIYEFPSGYATGKVEFHTVVSTSTGASVRVFTTTLDSDCKGEHILTQEEKDTIRSWQNKTFCIKRYGGETFVKSKRYIVKSDIPNGINPDTTYLPSEMASEILAL